MRFLAESFEHGANERLALIVPGGRVVRERIAKLSLCTRGEDLRYLIGRPYRAQDVSGKQAHTFRWRAIARHAGRRPSVDRDASPSCLRAVVMTACRRRRSRARGRRSVWPFARAGAALDAPQELAHGAQQKLGVVVLSQVRGVRHDHELGARHQLRESRRG